MDFRDRDGAPLINWDDAERRSRRGRTARAGRPCDYTGMTYDAAARRQRHPVAVHRRSAGRHRAALHRRALQHRPRLLRDVRPRPRDRRARSARRQYRAKEPDGRAFLHAADYEPPPEVADDEYPLLLTTGRTLYHFHTRTKTGRAPELAGRRARRVGRAAARPTRPRLGIERGRPRRVESRARRDRGAGADRGHPRGRRLRAVPLRLLGSTTGGPARAANELTITAWDPVSKQPLFKVGGRRDRAGATDAARATTSGCCTPPSGASPTRSARSPPRTATRSTSSTSASGWRRSATRTQQRLAPFADRYGEAAETEPDRLHSELFRRPHRRLGAAARPARPLPDGLRVRSRVDGRRPGRAGRPRRRAARGGPGVRGRDRRCSSSGLAAG